MKETLTRGVVWQGAELVIQEAKRPDGTNVFGFPGAIVLTGEEPVEVLRADLTRKLGYNFSELSMGDDQVFDDNEYDAHFFETRVPQFSIAARSKFHFWYMDQVIKAMQDGRLAPLSAKYIEESFINGLVDN